MKKMMLWCALLGLSLASCEKKPAAQTSASASAPERVALSTPEPHLVAPAGVFFLIKKVSMETDSGVANYRPGTKVHRVGGRYVASDGRQLTLRSDQMTNNLQLAQQAAGNDPKAQAIIQSTVQTARVLQASKPPAATPATSTAMQSAPASKDYAKPAVIKDGEAESRRFDNSRKNRN